MIIATLEGNVGRSLSDSEHVLHRTQVLINPNGSYEHYTSWLLN